MDTCFPIVTGQMQRFGAIWANGRAPGPLPVQTLVQFFGNDDLGALSSRQTHRIFPARPPVGTAHSDPNVSEFL